MIEKTRKSWGLLYIFDRFLQFYLLLACFWVELVQLILQTYFENKNKTVTYGFPLREDRIISVTLLSVW